MSNLKEYILKDCVELIIDHRGKTPAKMGGDWVENGFRVISALNVHNGFIDNVEQIRCVSEDVYKRWMSEDIKRNDCFITSEGASLGENCIWDSEEKIVLGQRLYAIRTNPEVLDPWYFACYMQTKKFRVQIDQISTGSTVFGISQPVLLNVKLLLPEISQQRLIGELYKSIKRKIENNNIVIEELESMAKTIYDYWFFQFDFLDKDGKPYKSSGGKMVWNEALKREIPEEWNAIKLGQIFDFVKGRIPDELWEDRDDDLVDYLTIEAVNEGATQYCKSNSMVLTNGEVLMVMDGAASSEVYVGNKGAIGSTLCKLQIKDNFISNNLLYLIMKKYENVFKKVNTGSTVPHANKNYINDFWICMPKKASEREHLQVIFDEIIEKIIHAKKENRELASLRDFLLPLLMNGQVSFKN